MKKHVVTLLILTCLGAFSWAQGSKELFDARKSREELEIMRGILGTTMSFVSQNAQRSAGTTPTARSGQYISTSSWRVSNINAFYLYGQGAVFVIPSSSLRMSAFFNQDGVGFAFALDEAGRALEAAKADIERVGAKRAASSGVGAPAAAPMVAQTPKPTAPAAAPQSQEELRKKLAEQVEKSKKSREDLLASREKLQKMLDEMKGYLIETLANYGDSLTTVKPNEYINIVFSTDDADGFALMNDGSAVDARRQVISVQKSWITDYKAGRLSMDAFKQKALQYNQ
jgi:hypothetical protein